MPALITSDKLISETPDVAAAALRALVRCEALFGGGWRFLSGLCASRLSGRMAGWGVPPERMVISRRSVPADPRLQDGTNERETTAATGAEAGLPTPAQHPGR